MKKRGEFLLFVVTFSLILFFQLACAYEYEATNISLDSNQIQGDLLSGNFVLSLMDAPINLIFSSELGKISLSQLFANEGKELGCEVNNCSGVYSVTDSGSPSLSFVSNPSGVVYGLLFTGEGVSSLGFNMVISAVFPESDKVPFTMLVGKNYRLIFDSASENLTHVRQTTYGCFNPAVTFTNGSIDSVGYCEEVNLTDSKSYFIGANISGSGAQDFIFSLTQDGNDIGTCSQSVSSSANYLESVGCMVKLSERQSAGKYEACIKTASEGVSNYKVKKESVGTNCGHYSSVAVRNVDYSIFVKVPMYASSSGVINLGESFSGSSVDSLNSYLSTVYGGVCSDGCVVPITFEGNNISLSVSNIKSDYSSATGPETNNLLYSLAADFFRVTFSNSISFRSFNWPVTFVGNKSLDIYLEGDGAVNKLLTANLLVKSAPVVYGIYPTEVPAGIEVYLYASVDNNFTKLIWNFGDGSASTESNKSYVKHKYTNVSSDYNVSITAVGLNSSILRSFTIKTISPENYINQTLDLKRAEYNLAISELNNLSVLYRDFIKNKLGLDSVQAELVQIEVDRAGALSSIDFLNIVNKINSLVIPLSIRVYESKTGALDYSYSDSDPSIVSIIVPGNYSAFDEYKSPIYSWQLKNIESAVSKQRLRAVKDNKEVVELITSYDVNLKSKSEDTAYLIIQEPKANLHFGSGVESTEVEGRATYIEIPAGQEKTISFFVEGVADLVMFVSPTLDVLPIGSEVSVCDVNGVCQKDLGENSDNCRSDCVPVMSTTLMILGALIFMLILYTVLQIWYVVRYEKYLFKDRVYLFNLLAFINNSKLNAKSQEEIYTTLSSKEWSHEQIEYAIKKSEGKNTGMFELLPVQKIIAYFEMKKANKNRTENIAPPINISMGPHVMLSRLNMPPRQQPRRNIGSNQFNNRRDITKI